MKDNAPRIHMTGTMARPQATSADGCGMWTEGVRSVASREVAVPGAYAMKRSFMRMVRPGRQLL